MKSFSEAETASLLRALEITKYGLSVPQQKLPLPLSLAEYLKWASSLEEATASALTTILPLLFVAIGKVRSPMKVYFVELINFPTVNSQSPIWSTPDLSISLT